MKLSEEKKQEILKTSEAASALLKLGNIAYMPVPLETEDDLRDVANVIEKISKRVFTEDAPCTCSNCSREHVPEKENIIQLKITFSCKHRKVLEKLAGDENFDDFLDRLISAFIHDHVDELIKNGKEITAQELIDFHKSHIN